MHKRYLVEHREQLQAAKAHRGYPQKVSTPPKQSPTPPEGRAGPGIPETPYVAVGVQQPLPVFPGAPSLGSQFSLRTARVGGGPAKALNSRSSSSQTKFSSLNTFPGNKSLLRTNFSTPKNNPPPTDVKAREKRGGRYIGEVRMATHRRWRQAISVQVPLTRDRSKKSGRWGHESVTWILVLGL